MANQYYFTLYDDGSTGWSYTEVAPVLYKPGRFASYAEYATVYAANRETSYYSTLTQKEASVVQTQQIRDAYITMGIPPTTASIMSGYNGAVVDRDAFIADHDTYVLVRPSAEEVAAGMAMSAEQEAAERAALDAAVEAAREDDSVWEEL